MRQSVLMSRRHFMRACGACASAVSAILAGCASPSTTAPSAEAEPPLKCPAPRNGDVFDYVVVGSGAGGGPLAANLALAGFRVLLLEAGGADENYDYQVPAFHARASEDEKFAWNFYVRHYADDTQQRRDEKFVAEQDGVLYPRCATLGGCTAHNAMIIIYPHNSDWDHIADVTGDRSWTSDNMRRYFERLERCEYPAAPGSRHGFNGWLPTNVADPKLMFRDTSLTTLALAMMQESLATTGGPITRVPERLQSYLDPNDWRLVMQSGEGICKTPLSTHQGRRAGTREYIRRVQRACPDLLVVQTYALATRVLLDERNRATGVEYLSGESLYRADPRHQATNPAQRMTALAAREVILCAGAFNTPQLLKLSGIGPRGELERFGIQVKVELPGVGENLQDRYEVCVVSKMKKGFSLMQGMTLRPPSPGETPDPQFKEWLTGNGPYTTNGAVISLIRRSSPQQPEPDLFIFGLLGSFQGYFPGYSDCIAREDDLFTWAVLKAHTSNTGGCVKLRSADPRDTPKINFHYFEQSRGSDDDLAAVVEGVRTVRRITARCEIVTAEEVLPGKAIETDEQIAEFVKDNAWGHHASCSCKMGPASDPMAVTDSRFRVHGTRNLRVVDASVFPKIPGFFIASAVYMLSEKASDVIIDDASAASARADRPKVVA
ncbi:MAG TPA: GMC oxidoreductase [Casimicrobiaceae bacterium]|nr:GMC oxidoreductase [Casimicrobiaceae bacterium]